MTMKIPCRQCPVATACVESGRCATDERRAQGDAAMTPARALDINKRLVRAYMLRERLCDGAMLLEIANG